MKKIITILLAIVAISITHAKSPKSSYTTKLPYKPGSKVPVIVKEDQFEWKTLPSGVQVAVLEGDPKKPGPFTLRLKYPPGFSKAPHYHLGAAYVTVLGGSNNRGYGTVFDKSKGVNIQAGSFSVNPAHSIHFEWTEEPALIQVHAIGPWKTIYVDTKGNPIPKKNVKDTTLQMTM
jgi:anti-sigma factor ChrR (cupin superfamily)